MEHVCSGVTPARGKEEHFHHQGIAVTEISFSTPTDHTGAGNGPGERKCGEMDLGSKGEPQTQPGAMPSAHIATSALGSTGQCRAAFPALGRGLASLRGGFICSLLISHSGEFRKLLELQGCFRMGSNL